MPQVQPVVIDLSRGLFFCWWAASYPGLSSTFQGCGEVLMVFCHGFYPRLLLLKPFRLLVRYPGFYLPLMPSSHTDVVLGGGASQASDRSIIS